MKKVVLIVFLLFSLLSVSAQEQQTLGGVDGFPPSTDIELLQVCATCTQVNITVIKLGNGTLFPIYQMMTKNASVYNYTFVKNQTSSLGEYIVNWEADPEGKARSGNYNFFIRKGGVLLTTGESIIYIILMVVNFLATWFFLHFGFAFPYSDARNEEGTLSKIIPQKYLKLLSILIGYGFLLWMMNIFSSIVNTFVSLDFVSNLVTNLYIFSLVIGYLLTVVILILLFIEWWRDLIVPIIKLLLRKHGKRKK